MGRGQVIVWTQGSPVEQLRKMVYGNISSHRRDAAAENGRHPHELLTTIATQNKFDPEVLDRLADAARGHQVFVAEDRLSNLARITTELEARGVVATPLWIQQGRHGHKIPKEMSGRDANELEAAYNAQPSLAEANKAIAHLRNPELPPLFVADYDGVVACDELQAALQLNAIKQELAKLGVPGEYLELREPSTIVTEFSGGIPQQP